MTSKQWISAICVRRRLEKPSGIARSTIFTLTYTPKTHFLRKQFPTFWTWNSQVLFSTLLSHSYLPVTLWSPFRLKYPGKFLQVLIKQFRTKSSQVITKENLSHPYLPAILMPHFPSWALGEQDGVQFELMI